MLLLCVPCDRDSGFVCDMCTLLLLRQNWPVVTLVTVTHVTGKVITAQMRFYDGLSFVQQQNVMISLFDTFVRFVSV